MLFPDFFIDYDAIQRRIDAIEPDRYGATRNYLDGAVTYLSPFITHGIIDTKTIADGLMQHHTGVEAEKLLTELAWREYFHRVWQLQGDDIFSDMRHPQENVDSEEAPTAILQANSGIQVIDDCVRALKAQGYMHNHARMWVAALTCNTARTHWYQPARWLYYHLLDGDLASNCLSWQWIAGSFSHQKYIANQDNLNRFSKTRQHTSFIDMSYEELQSCSVPDELRSRGTEVLQNQFPSSNAAPVLPSDAQVMLHSIWNLDPLWRQGETGRRILWIEPSLHKEFALSPLRWKFVQHWADQIEGLEVFVGEQQQLFPQGCEKVNVISREYPATAHWPTSKDGFDQRRWCYPAPTGSIKSFSNYWRPIRKSSELFKES